MSQTGGTEVLRCHFVWIGRVLPYHARLAIESALHAMPDARVDLHYVGPPANGLHADVVAGYRRVEVHAQPLASYFAEVPGTPRRYVEVLETVPYGSPAAISNLVRLAVLHRHGGVYLDTDALVIRALHDPRDHGAYLGVERAWAGSRSYVEHGPAPGLLVRSVPWACTWALRRADCRLTHGRARLARRLPDRSVRMQPNNAVLGAPMGSPFLAEALARATRADATKRFALGPSLLADLVADRPDLVHVVPPSRFYAIPPGQSYRWFEDERCELPPDAQVAHYVASNHRRLLRRLEPDDPRFERRSAPFWRIARAVRAAAPAFERDASAAAVGSSTG